MLQFIFLLLLIKAISGSHRGILHSNSANKCYDKDPDCSNDICQNYPYTAKERCPKFCGLCHDSSSSRNTGHLTSTSSSSHQQTRKSLISCTDKNSDCTAEICRNYPFTAKERCAKTCNLCSGDTSSSGSTASGHHHTMVGIDKSRGGSTISSLSPRREISSISSGLCFDKNFDCKKETCRDFPFIAREECAKTCGFCSSDSFDGIAFTTISPSRHASIRLNERGGGGGGSGGIGSSSSGISKYGDNENTRNAPSHSKLLKDKELDCVDLNIDCTQQICKDYPFTAKERCAKTCGFCRKQEIDGRDTTNIGTLRSRTPEFDRRNKASVATVDCRDEDSQCSERSCLEQPHKARTKCAKTCGFCGEKSSQGSIIELKSPSVNIPDDDNVITLDSDIGSSSVQSTAISGHRLTSGNSDGILTQNSQRSSISSRTDLSRKSSSSSAHIQQPTNKPYLGEQKRYPGRTGPCTDDNRYCEKADCYKYPRFSQRYCEKTCNYC
ncbi:ShK domain-like family protein [Acanthocheilonema viteae]